jgi:hypothetical protein
VLLLPGPRAANRWNLMKCSRSRGFTASALLRFFPCPISENVLSETEPQYDVEISPWSSTNDSSPEGGRQSEELTEEALLSAFQVLP